MQDKEVSCEMVSIYEKMYSSPVIFISRMKFRIRWIIYQLVTNSQRLLTFCFNTGWVFEYIYRLAIWSLEIQISTFFKIKLHQTKNQLAFCVVIQKENKFYRTTLINYKTFYNYNLLQTTDYLSRSTDWYNYQKYIDLS